MNEQSIDLVEVKLLKDFLVVKETLSRIGVISAQKKELYQSCHILHKKGKYYIVSFKEMFLLDGKSSSFNEEDKARRNTIIDIISNDFKLVEVVDKSKVETPKIEKNKVKILSFKEKDNWKLITKYNLGNKK